MSRLSRYARPYRLPLSERDIRRSLRLGFGRIHLHHRVHGLDDHSESLFQACLRNMVYDQQCEPSRASWLLQLLNEEQEEELSRRLTDIMPRTRRRKNLYQHCELCLLLAKKGHAPAKSALYKAFRVDPCGDAMAADEIMELDGAEVLVWLCEATLATVERVELKNVVERFVWNYDYDHGKGEGETVIRQTSSLSSLWSCFDPEPAPKTARHQQRLPQHSKKSARELTVSDILD